MFKLLLLSSLLNLCWLPAYTQQLPEVTTKQTGEAPVLNFSFADNLNKKAIALQNNIEQKTLHTLERLQKQENRLWRKLAIKDSAAATALFPDATIKLSSSASLADGSVYQQLANNIKSPAAVQSLKEYIPQFDSLKTSLAFLSQASVSTKLPPGFADKIKTASANMEGLQTKLQQANEIQNYIKERRETLKNGLEKFGMVQDMQKLNKEAYYYKQQLNEYKEILKNPQKAEEKAVAILTKLPAFNEFMKKNSMLASLFRLPDDYGTAQSLAGLQTRASVEAQLQQRFGAAAVTLPSGGAGGGSSFIQQQVQQAQGEMGKLKDKINAVGGGSSDLEMPDFSPNPQKTKSFLKRIEYGANIQSQKTNYWLPVTSDLALTTGYKINDKSTIGIGASYKLGWGSGWKHIKLSNEGVGLRSYIDWKLKPIFGKIEGFWVSGGYEQNYQQAFTQINELKDLNAWQTSGLIGLTKKYKLGKKINNFQVLWDFLSYRQVPARQPILFRVGYVF